MDDLIRRSDVMDKVEVINWYQVNADGKLVSGAAEEADAFIHYSDAVEAIEKAPAVDDVAKVVRCEDCRYYEGKFIQSNGETILRCWLWERNFYSSGYCSWGQRREDGDA